ncbi:MAG: hypothetical protein QOK12_2602, partial [Mycobacterium sp.]|nr:hypothetical protein [Mycobacterium sp.]
RRKAPGGIIGADVHDDLTRDAVRFGDPPDHEVHQLLIGVHHVDADAAAAESAPADDAAAAE